MTGSEADTDKELCAPGRQVEVGGAEVVTALEEPAVAVAEDRALVLLVTAVEAAAAVVELAAEVV